MSFKKMQQYFIRSLFKSNQVTDSNLIKSIFKREFNIPLILNMSEITKQKYLGIGGSTQTDMLSICKNISNADLLVNVKSVDIFYNYKFKNNKVIKREEKVIFILHQKWKK